MFCVDQALRVSVEVARSRAPRYCDSSTVKFKMSSIGI